MSALTERIESLRAAVNAQAEDEGLWFIAESATEEYLQQELRALHASAEALIAYYDLNGAA